MSARITHHNHISPDIFLDEIIWQTHGVDVHIIKLDDEKDFLPPLVVVVP